MHITIAGGTGFIGQFLVKGLLNEGHQLTVITRSRGKVQQLFGDRVTVLDWNTLRQYGSGTLVNCDLLINLCGAGIADERWSKARKQELITSRIKPTATLAKYCLELGAQAPALFNASAIGIYGTQKPRENDLPDALDEDAPMPNRSMDFAQEIVQNWEAALKPAQLAGVRVVKMRFGVVLGHGGALKKLLPAYKLGLGGKLGSGQQPFSWICLIDILRALLFCYEHKDIHGAVNFVAPNCVTQAQFAKTLGTLLKRPTFLKTPEFVMQAAYGELADDLLLNGQHIVPKILLEHGFAFQYPTLKEALIYGLGSG